MCGIVGYIGTKQAQSILLNGLEKLEYRGYDSAGMAIIVKGKVSIRKQRGKIAVLSNLLKKKPLKGSIGISHSRWATHGIPNQRNAHPHADCFEKIAVVHNGIIENYEDLKESLIQEGHIFKSETDTEVIAHLIEKFYKDDIEAAVRTTLKLLKGSFAIGVILGNHPEQLIVARLGSPIVIGLGKGENFIASDVPALLEYTKSILFLEDYEMAVLTRGDVVVSSFDGKIIKRQATAITWDATQAEKGGYAHFMLKEMYEQPSVIEGIVHHRVSEKKDSVYFQELKISEQKLEHIEKIAIVACGTAYHAGLTGKYILESLTGIPVEVDVSSEFRYRRPILNNNTLVIAISQSGEQPIHSQACEKQSGAALLYFQL